MARAYRFVEIYGGPFQALNIPASPSGNCAANNGATEVASMGYMGVS